MKLTLNAPHAVIAVVVYVPRLQRLYHLHKTQIAEMLTALISLHSFKIDERRAALNVLDLHGSHARLDFTDALLIALVPASESSVVYSYDCLARRMRVRGWQWHASRADVNPLSPRT